MAKGFNGVLSRLFPSLAESREKAQVRLEMLQRQRAEAFGSGKSASSGYAPVGGGRRSREFHRNARDASSVMHGVRGTLAYIARDMLRNNPRVVRANNLIAGHTVGSGIRPVVEMRSGEAQGDKDTIEGLIRDHLLTTALDADGNSTLFGLQALAMKTIPVSGEVLLRRRFRRASDGLPLPFQVQILETDYIASTKSMGRPTGRMIYEGIEYGPTGRAEFFHLYSQHPGSTYGGGEVRRVSADNVVHAFLIDRPGQRRGVSWYTPVMAELMDMHKFMQASLKRQEMAAMFAGMLKRGGDDDPDNDDPDFLTEISAGGITELGADDELTFNTPPSPLDMDPVTRNIDRVIATGLMLSYESFTGDYGRVNYTSGRMGRMDQDPIVRFWQEELVVARMMAKLTTWFKEAVDLQTGIDPASYRLNWTAPRRPVVDPTRDYPAMVRRARAGLTSVPALIREAGDDPARVYAEIKEWSERNDADEMVFDTDPRRVSLAGVTQARAAGTDFADEKFDDPDEEDEADA